MKKLNYILVLLFLSSYAYALELSEVLVANTHTNLDPQYNEFSSWIELYNESAQTVHVGGYYLSDDSNNPKKWKIPGNPSIGAHRYLLIWADGKNSGLHTNFKLKTSGESIVLSDNDGNIIESVDYPEQKSDISFGVQNGQINYMYPTPNAKNGQSYPNLILSKKPKFSLDSGFYNGSQTVELTQKNGATIYYTTDGSIPTKQSHKYTDPIIINKTTLIRARAYEDGKFPSGIKNRTYLIDEDISLPVMSIAINQEYLDDDKIGIYKNYKEDWMRPGSVEYIKDGKSQFSANVGIRINGNRSRRKPQKSLAFYAKSKYGTKSIDYPLFQYKPFIKKVKSFVLRNAGNDWEYSHMRDGLFHTLVKDTMDIDYLSYQPVIAFINGQYWGILNLREKPNEDYIEANHGVDAHNIDLLAFHKIEIKSGDDKDYRQLLSYLDTHPLTNSNNYQYVKSQVDIDELINYEITEIYIGNTDWPGGNIKYWKEKSPKGKWRWILYDTDFGFGYMERDDVTKDTFEYALKTDKTTTKIFRKLLENSDFKNRFISRFFTHLNSTFRPDRVIDIMEKLKGKIAPEMPRHNDFWKHYQSWMGPGLDNEVNKMEDYAKKRNAIVRSQLKQRFGLGNDLQLSINKSPHGIVKIDGVALENNYTGTYFENATVALEAKADAGYQFVKWSDGSTAKQREVTLVHNLKLSPIFEKKQAEQAPKIVITQINYKSAKDFDVGDWVEIYNNDTKDIDLSGFILKDAQDTSPFVFPNGTILKQGASLIITHKKSDFQALYPSVKNVIGDFSFGLGTEDSVRLFNTNQTLVDSVTYDKSWPDAKGNGKTLSLKDPNSDNAKAENWIASENHGTPGEGDSNAPNPPSNLVLTPLSSSSVRVQWKDNSDDEIGFKIFRDGVLIDTTASNATSFVDTGLKAQTTYTYTVKATK